MLGDAAFETHIIRDQLASLKKSSMFLSSDETSYVAEIRSLYDNAALEKNNLGLEVGKALTDTQRKSLMALSQIHQLN